MRARGFFMRLSWSPPALTSSTLWQVACIVRVRALGSAVYIVKGAIEATGLVFASLQKDIEDPVQTEATTLIEKHNRLKRAM